jgi:hypothetical protein
MTSPLLFSKIKSGFNPSVCTVIHLACPNSTSASVKITKSSARQRLSVHSEDLWVSLLHYKTAVWVAPIHIQSFILYMTTLHITEII